MDSGRKTGGKKWYYNLTNVNIFKTMKEKMKSIKITTFGERLRF